MRSIATASSSASPVTSEPRLTRGAATVALLAGLLLIPALANRFPLIFPDSGTYLGIATGHDYAIDRSSVYGLLLKPFVSLLPGLGGLWLAIVAQALAVAAILLLAAHALAGRPGLVACLAAIPLTSLAWHAGQFMPDAFTGPLILLTCLAATRDPAAPGAPLLWLGALVLALTHYTHVVLLATVGMATVATHFLVIPAKAGIHGSHPRHDVAGKEHDSLQPPPKRRRIWKPALRQLATLFLVAKATRGKKGSCGHGCGCDKKK